MRATEFDKIRKNIASYSGKQVVFKSYVPSADRYTIRKGEIIGIGTDANEGCLIVRAYGLYAVYYKNVKAVINR